MATRIRQLISAEQWYAVFARISSARDAANSSGRRPTFAASVHRGAGPAPEFLPLVAWALVVDDAGSEPDRIVGVVVNEDLAPELVPTDDPSFLGYAGPGDSGVDRARLTPDWRALAKQAIAQLKSSSQFS